MKLTYTGKFASGYYNNADLAICRHCGEPVRVLKNAPEIATADKAKEVSYG